MKKIRKLLPPAKEPIPQFKLFSAVSVSTAVNNKILSHPMSENKPFKEWSGIMLSTKMYFWKYKGNYSLWPNQTYDSDLPLLRCFYPSTSSVKM